MELGITEHHWKCLAQGKEALLRVLNHWPACYVPQTEEEARRFVRGFEKANAVLEEFVDLDSIRPPIPWNVQEGYKRVLELSFSYELENLVAARQRYVDTVRLSKRISKNGTALYQDLRRLARTQIAYDRRVLPYRQRMIGGNCVTGMQESYCAMLDVIPVDDAQVLAGYGFRLMTTHRLLPQDLPRLLALTEEMELWYHKLGGIQRNSLNRLRFQAHERVGRFASELHRQDEFTEALYRPYEFLCTC